MVHSSDLSFYCLYSHVKAHQDNNIQYRDLTQPTQLNCQMDYHTKKQSGTQVQWRMRLLDSFRQATSERQILDLAKSFSSADQSNLYFIQIIINIRQFCGIDKKKFFFLINHLTSTKMR